MSWNDIVSVFVGGGALGALVGVLVGPARAAGGQEAAMAPRPPVARKDPRVTEIHGVRLVDDYHWLRERSSPEVLAYLEAENAYTEAMMAHTAKLQEALYRELRGRIKEDDSSPPYREDGWLYYYRTEQDKPYRIYCRKQGSAEAPEEVLLDLNREAEGHAYFDLGVLEVSPDHRLLAYSIDTTGAEAFTLRIKDLTTGELLADVIENTYYSLAWASDNRTFFYTTLDAAKRPFKLHRHRLGEATDIEIYHEPDDRFWVDVARAKSGDYLFMTLSSSASTESWWLPAGAPEEAFRRLRPRQEEVEYYVDHRGDSFYILTNLEAENFRIARTPVAAAPDAPWEDFVAHRPEVKIEEMDMFRDRMVLLERAAGLQRLRVVPFDGGEAHVVELPEAAYELVTAENPEFGASTYRFLYSSLVTPKTWYDYDIAARRLELVKREEVIGYDPAGYATERMFATAPDGAQVPITIAYRRDLEHDGDNPCLLIGYGAYGAPYDPSFSPHNLSLMDRGFVVAIAHIRGGGEMGESWHQGGRMLNKKNTFTDFIAAAEELIARRWTSPQGLAIRGRSAGGLLMGAVTTMRPDLFAVVIAGVPFVDVINTMLDETIPLTANEFDEWGNPDDGVYFDYMLSYSPYDQTTARDYPHLLVTAGLNDPRVQYWEPAKWVAKLRAVKTDDHLLLLKTDMGAGHAGPTDRYAALRERAFEYAFLFDRLGIER